MAHVREVIPPPVKESVIVVEIPFQQAVNLAHLSHKYEGGGESGTATGSDFYFAMPQDVKDAVAYRIRQDRRNRKFDSPF